MVRAARTRHSHPDETQPVNLSPGDAAVVEGRTKFPHAVRDPYPGESVLKSGIHNSKIGDFTVKHRSRPAPMFTLTLEERATCDRACPLWLICEGNHLHWSPRFRDGPALREAIRRDIEWYSVNHPAGFYVRVHVLGDFFSVEYVQFWHDLLNEFPALRVWGFTFRKRGTRIGDAIQRMIAAHPRRCLIRMSFGDEPTMCSRTFKREEVPPGAGTIEHNGFTSTVCPVERGVIKTCADCGICFSRSKSNIAFILR